MSIEHVGAAQVRTKLLSNLGPAHQLVNGEQSEQLSVERDLRVTGVSKDALQKVVLFVIVRGEDDKVNDALQDLKAC